MTAVAIAVSSQAAVAISSSSSVVVVAVILAPVCGSHYTRATRVRLLLVTRAVAIMIAVSVVEMRNECSACMLSGMQWGLTPAPIILIKKNNFRMIAQPP